MTSSTPPRINVVAWDNGFGLSRELRLIAEVLGAAGMQVHVSAVRRGKLRKWLRPWKMRAIAWRERLRGRDPRDLYTANLLVEHIRPEDLPLARCNLFSPHPEWCLPKDVALLPAIDLVLAKTRHAEPIFQAHGCRTAFVSSTSDDRMDRAVPRQRAFFHLAGRSQNKGTEALLALWRRHPEWPRLTVLQNPRTAQPGPPVANIDHRVGYISDQDVRQLQNSHRFHLCPSETEGFGHYLMEAMSVGAVTIATDAPPMNELVTPDRGLLVRCNRTGTQNLATTYFFDDAAMEAAVERALALSDAECEAIGARARAFYDDNDRAFRRRLAEAVAAAV